MTEANDLQQADENRDDPLLATGQASREIAHAPASSHETKLADFIAGQIAMEQSLVGSRMTWNLTFQGFAIAGFAVISTAVKSSPSQSAIQLLVVFVSFAIALSTLQGIRAAGRQSTYLKATWAANGLTQFFPEPFSDPLGSGMGRSPSRNICYAILAMWTLLFGLLIAAWCGIRL